MSVAHLVRLLLVALALVPLQAWAQVGVSPSADTVPDPSLPSAPVLCPAQSEYRIEGESHVKIGTSQEYRVSWPLSGSGNAMVTYSLLRA